MHTLPLSLIVHQHKEARWKDVGWWPPTFSTALRIVALLMLALNSRSPNLSAAPITPTASHVQTFKVTQLTSVCHSINHRCSRKHVRQQIKWQKSIRTAKWIVLRFTLAEFDVFNDFRATHGNLLWPQLKINKVVSHYYLVHICILMCTLYKGRIHLTCNQLISYTQNGRDKLHRPIRKSATTNVHPQNNL